MKTLTKKRFYGLLQERGKMVYGHCFLNDGDTPEKVEARKGEILSSMQNNNLTRQFKRVYSFGVELLTQGNEISTLRHETGDKYFMLDNMLVAYSPNFAACFYL